MRQGLTLVAVFISAGLGLGVTSRDATAQPLPTVSSTVVAPSLIHDAGYSKRYCRRYGCPPPVVVLPDAAADVDVDVTVPGETPPIIAIVPVRPVSCGRIQVLGRRALRRRALQQPVSRATLAATTHG